MIIVKLIGGLGNQMFQYALGRKLSILHQDELLLDCSFFDEKGSHTPRHYELDIFPIHTEMVDARQLEKFQPKKYSRFASLFQRLFLINREEKSFREKGHQFHPEVFQLRGDMHLIGYWQSEKYFSDIADVIHRDFSFMNEPAGLNKQLSENIQSCNAVSLHIRRGDYVTNNAANSFHGLCGIDYYQRGVEHIQSKSDNIHLFIFSDDIHWAKENLHFDVPMTFMDHNHGKTSYEDMRLMSLCKHHIIANSSFSWWGAWLNADENKIVVAPKQWFLDTSINTDDVVPDKWIKM